MKTKRTYYKGKRCSKGEKEIAIFLDLHNINYIQEFKLINCLSEKGNPLRVDFYLPNKNIIIEYQGQHHFKPVNKYRRAKIVYEQTFRRDQQKKDFIILNNIGLLTIDYTEFDNICKILTKYIL